MKSPIFALIDCNNFFVSCLRLFRPDLEGQPVVALSSNDGCVVARSNEAKTLGIPMGAPAFKWQSFFKQNNVAQMSGNFELYGDISRRIIDLCTSITPNLEIYSVDEAFLDLSKLNIKNHTDWGNNVTKLIAKNLGITVSVGIAPTKTLAKLATYHIKKNSELNNVLDILSCSPTGRLKYLAETPIKDIWGVGRQLAPRLKIEGFNTAKDISLMSPQYAQKLMGITGRQLVAELNGVSCNPLQKINKPAKSIAVTRTFGKDTSSFGALESALTNFATKAAYRLRANGQVARRLGFFMSTNKLKPNYVNYSSEITFKTPTNDSAKFIRAAIALAAKQFSSNRQYHRAGIWLYDLTKEGCLQADLLNPNIIKSHTKDSSRMKAIDVLNQRYGKNTIRYASEDINNSWLPKHNIDTPRYTTSWEELPRIRPAKIS